MDCKHAACLIFWKKASTWNSWVLEDHPVVCVGWFGSRGDFHEANLWGLYGDNVNPGLIKTMVYENWGVFLQ